MHSLTVSPRTVVGKSSAKLSQEGLIPAVVYGPKQDPISIAIPTLAFQAFLRQGGQSGLVTLTGLDKELPVLVHDMDRDPVTHLPIHVDFYAVEKGAKVTVMVPLAFVGESMAVKQGANLVKVLHEVEIEADPSKIPSEIEVSIESLANIDDRITVADMKAPAGVTILTPEDEVIVIAQAVQEETEESSAGPDMDAIEVEKKGKSESEEEGE